MEKRIPDHLPGLLPGSSVVRSHGLGRASTMVTAARTYADPRVRRTGKLSQTFTLNTLKMNLLLKSLALVFKSKVNALAIKRFLKYIKNKGRVIKRLLFTGHYSNALFINRYVKIEVGH